MKKKYLVLLIVSLIFLYFLYSYINLNLVKSRASEEEANNVFTTSEECNTKCERRCIKMKGSTPPRYYCIRLNNNTPGPTKSGPSPTRKFLPPGIEKPTKPQPTSTPKPPNIYPTVKAI